MGVRAEKAGVPPPVTQSVVITPTAQLTPLPAGTAVADTARRGVLVQQSDGIAPARRAAGPSATPAQLTVPAGRRADGVLAAALDAPAIREAVATQRELVRARVRYGGALLRIERLTARRDDLRARWTLPLGQEHRTNQVAIANLEREITNARGGANVLHAAVSAAEGREAAQLATNANAVDRARFLVSLERYAELEIAHGPEAAARMARQFHYNAPGWNSAAGTRPATAGELMSIGMPHYRTEGHNENVAEFISPRGDRVDLGHVYAALDWTINADRLGGAGTALRAGRALGLALPDIHDPNFVEFVGDLGSAVIRWQMSGLTNAREALAQEGEADLRGDIDALNIAHDARAGAPVRDRLARYYAGTPPGSDRRVDRLLEHWAYVRNGGVDVERLAADVAAAVPFLPGGTEARDITSRSRAVSQELVRWLATERRAAVPTYRQRP